MKALCSLIACAFLACVVGAVLAQTAGGGYPSQARFQSVTVSGVPVQAAGKGVSATAGTTTTLDAAGSIIPVPMSTEDFDTGNFHNTVTLNSRVTLPNSTGYAACAGSVTGFTGNSLASTNHDVKLWLRKNGTDYIAVSRDLIYSSTAGSVFSFALTVANSMISANGSDYVELVANQSGFSTTGSIVANATTSSGATTRLSCTSV